MSKVLDSFEVKGRVAIEYGAEGVIVIISPFEPDDAPIAGNPVLIIRPDGWMRTAAIGEVKVQDVTPGFFIAGARRQDVPVGTQLVWGDELASRAMEFLAVA